LLTTLLTGMSWSRLGDTQGFGMQCVPYISHYVDSFLSRYYGAHHGIFTNIFSQITSSCTAFFKIKTYILLSWQRGLHSGIVST
jgi:hypothetical protein